MKRKYWLIRWLKILIFEQLKHYNFNNNKGEGYMYSAIKLSVRKIYS